MKTLRITALATVLCLSFACSSDDPDPTPDPNPGTDIVLSPESLEFVASPAGAQTVTVTTSITEWTATPDAKWITAVRDGDELSVSVSVNEAYEPRSGKVRITAGETSVFLSVTQLAAELAAPGTALKLFPEFAGGIFNNVSSNGRYVAGFQTDGQGYVYDVYTGVTTDIFSTDDITGASEELLVCKVYDVSNDGSVVVGSFRSPDHMVGENYAFIPGVYRDGKWTELERVASDLAGQDLDGWAKAVTADGRYAVGAVRDGAENVAFGRILAVRWDLQTGKIDKMFDKCEAGQGGDARNISDDGTTAVGWSDLYGDYGRWGIIWRDGKETVTTADVGEIYSTSPNGVYCGGFQFVMEDLWNNVGLLWNETDGFSLTTMHENSRQSNIAGVADDGTAVGYSGDDLGMVRYPFIITPDGTFHDLAVYIQEVYGYTPSEELAGEDLSLTLYTPLGISADGKTICGFSSNRQPWVLTLGEPIAAE